jgi:hypothetical protein
MNRANIMKKSILQQNKHRAVNQKDLGIRRGLFFTLLFCSHGKTFDLKPTAFSPANGLK